MKILDPGHKYEVSTYDGEDQHQTISFMKREGSGYPGNTSHYPGTNCQELIRVLIDRVKYLDNQIPCDGNKRIINQLRHSLLEFELRACDRHGVEMQPYQLWDHEVEVELFKTCPICGHLVDISCKGSHNYEANHTPRSDSNATESQLTPRMEPVRTYCQEITWKPIS